jgi:hypothetical protein
MYAYAAGSAKDTARAWIRSPPLVPMPGHRARRSFCGLGVSGRTRVVVASRIHEEVGPREKYGPKPTVVWQEARPRSERSASALVADMLLVRVACAKTAVRAQVF